MSKILAGINTQRITILIFVTTAFVLVPLFLLNKHYVILTKSELDLLINQCDVVRADYRTALLKIDRDGRTDPQTTCFSSLEGMREAREFLYPYLEGGFSNSGGASTYRYSDIPTYGDDLSTTNDESNDQPLGYYGTDTVEACNGGSGNCYELDADVSDDNVERLYFPKGGWVDIDYSDCDGSYCYLEDENGEQWEITY